MTTLTMLALPETTAVLTYEVAGLTIDVWETNHYPGWPYFARIRGENFGEEGRTPVQAIERAFFNYCDVRVESLVMKEVAS